MEEINQSAAMWARTFPTINIVRRGAGGSTHGRVDALIFPSTVSHVGFVCYESSMHACTSVPPVALESKLSELVSPGGRHVLALARW